MIKLENVSKKFGPVQAVNDVTFHVDKGALCALLGPNGAGKSTIVSILMGFSNATIGKAFIDGIDVSDPEARKNVGYLPEINRIPPFLSGKEFLLRTAELNGSITGKEKHVEDIINRIGMSGKENGKVKTYSKGMLQRIGLGAALVGKPKLLILDEPVTGLDPIGIREFRMILEGLKADNITILLNSHLLSEVEKICDSAAIINRGTIITHGVLSEIVGEKDTLEDIFIRLVGEHNA